MEGRFIADCRSREIELAAVVCVCGVSLIIRVMLDIRLIREQPDLVKERLATRGGDDAAKIDELLEVDVERRKA